MEVSVEAKRIMVVALGKLYNSRTQRGGLRLHRSLLLTLVMKSARDMYHAAQSATESVAPGCEVQLSAAETDRGNKENLCPHRSAQPSRKRRGKAAVEPDFLPCKKAKLEQENCPQVVVNTVLTDFVNCGSGLGAPPTPLTLHRVIAAC